MTRIAPMAAWTRLVAGGAAAFVVAWLVPATLCGSVWRPGYVQPDLFFELFLACAVLGDRTDRPSRVMGAVVLFVLGLPAQALAMNGAFGGLYDVVTEQVVWGVPAVPYSVVVLACGLTAAWAGRAGAASPRVSSATLLVQRTRGDLVVVAVSLALATAGTFLRFVWPKIR